NTPVITSVNPRTFLVGTPSSTISVLGTSFVPTSQVQWNGTALVTSYVTVSGSSYLYGQVPDSLLSSVGSASITVSTPGAPAISNALTVTITNPPVPTLTSVSPSSAAIGSDVKLSMFGSGFTGASVVNFNGKP